MSRLEGKTAIITGSSRGIGFSIAKRFLDEGAKVAVCGSRLSSAQKAIDILKKDYSEEMLLPIGVDLTNTESVKEMVNAVVKKWNKVEILVNNAGITSTKGIFDMSDSDFTDVLDINLCGAFRCIREVAKVMKDNGGGSIVNTSSMVGTYGGKMQTAYSSSKFGINGLTKSCAKELGEYNIRVNAVAPGAVLTDMMAEFVDPRTKTILEQMTPLKRIAEPEELAGAYVYLASDEASFTTGTIIHVDGGIVM